VYAVAWSPFRPGLFLSASADWTLRLWSDAQAGPRSWLRPLHAHPCLPLMHAALGMQGSGRRLAFGSPGLSLVYRGIAALVSSKANTLYFSMQFVRHTLACPAGTPVLAEGLAFTLECHVC